MQTKYYEILGVVVMWHAEEVLWGIRCGSNVTCIRSRFYEILGVVVMWHADEVLRDIRCGREKAVRTASALTTILAYSMPLVDMLIMQATSIFNSARVSRKSTTKNYKKKYFWHAWKHPPVWWFSAPTFCKQTNVCIYVLMFFKNMEYRGLVLCIHKE